MPVPSQVLLLPIVSTDLSFFNDSFFEESRQHFNVAVKEITDRCGLSSKDPLSSYRSLREKELRVDNQAVAFTDEDNARKIVIDVKDFKDGELSVKVEDHSVVAEGRIERTEGGSSSTHSFRRRFSLPKSADIGTITSTISSDGILIVTAPKSGEPQITTGKHKSVKAMKKSSAMRTLGSSVITDKKTESQTELLEVSSKNNSNSSSKMTQTTISSKLTMEKDSTNP